MDPPIVGPFVEMGRGLLLALTGLSVVHKLLVGFLSLRVAQRVYYFLKGHVQYWTFDPRAEMSSMFSKHKIACTHHEFTSRDGVKMKYTKLGSGSKLVLLCNGVGTDLFMWLPLFREMYLAHPSIFDEVTLIAPSYRGLFGSDNVNGRGEVKVTMDNCAADLPEILKDIKNNRDHKGQFANTSKFDSIIGWSMGAQTAITSLALNPQLAVKLFLLNPSSGLTLHTALQSFMPLPAPIGKQISRVANYTIRSLLRPLIPGPVWDFLRSVAFSFFFRGCLEAGSFLGGSPPEQGAYFHTYMRDVFNTRNQTRGLLDLICSLDSIVPPFGLCLDHPTKIVSGVPDFLTGIYHSTTLAKGMPNSQHVPFSMGSHFLLIEWPELVALELIDLLLSPQQHQSTPHTRGKVQKSKPKVQ